MFTFLVILTIIAVIILVIIAGMQPVRSRMSEFELERRASDHRDMAALAQLRRNALLPDVISLLRITSALFLVITVLLSVATFGWLFGVIIALAIALEYGAIARLSFIKGWSEKLYQRIETHLLLIVEMLPKLFQILRSVNVESKEQNRLDSRQELQHLVAESGDILTHDERTLIVHSLSFNEQLVDTVMTPRSMIDSINKSEFLGPLLLDELHKKGHSRLPVIDQDIDHVVGVLHIQSLLALDIKKSMQAEKAMEARVFYIKQNQTLQHALAAFLRTHHHLFIVVNEFRETVGLLTLEDVIEALLGRKIVDEFDSHEDLRVVALRNPRDNNDPKKREDV